ncbi:MAG: hypothetical protein H0W96_04215 [Solirubrobacterales bacterium]|nr:hypothetical protein [Solirubrobacterales bacterium]
MSSHALLALSQAWTDSIGLLFTFAVLMPAIATVCIIVAMISGRGDKREDDRNAGRWGRNSSPDSE